MGRASDYQREPGINFRYLQQGLAGSNSIKPPKANTEFRQDGPFCPP